MKLKTKLEHSFEIESDLMSDLDFNFNIQKKNIKKTTEIIIVKKSKRKKDGSTGLF